MIFGGFTVDEETRAAGRSGGGDGANAAALFADDEQKCEIARATGEKRFGGGDHGGDDALGVAGAAAVNVGPIFARGEEGGNWVHVSREGDVGIAEREKEVVAARLRGLAIEASVVFRGERRQMGEEIVCHGLL